MCIRDRRDTGNASDYLPHNYPRNCVVYTGTHDNETLVSWLEDITPQERRQVRKYLNNFHNSGKELCDDLICLVMQSVADLCIIPIDVYKRQLFGLWCIWTRKLHICTFLLSR